MSKYRRSVRKTPARGMPQIKMLAGMIHERGKSQRQVADKAGTEPSALNRVLAGHQKAALADVEAWFNVLGYTLVPLPLMQQTKAPGPDATPVQIIRFDAKVRKNPYHVSPEDEWLMNQVLARLVTPILSAADILDRPKCNRPEAVAARRQLYVTLNEPPYCWPAKKIAVAVRKAPSAVFRQLALHKTENDEHCSRIA